MRTCFVLPGILGTVMVTPDNATDPGILWVNAGRLGLLHEFGAMALASNGRDPHPIWGQRCVPLTPIDEFWNRDYYGGLYRRLLHGLPSNYQTVPWGYDFRKSIPSVGDALARSIRQRATPEDPCSIVAHSQGGLVARWAWTVLQLAGEQQLIRRIVTLGTPHRGSYAPVVIWSLGPHDIIDQLIRDAGRIQSGGFNPWWFPWEAGIGRIDIERVLATWPSMYQLMPFVDSESVVYDPRRAELGIPANWPADVQLSSAHLLTAFGDWQTWASSATSLPPADVLTTVGGTGRNTPWKLNSHGPIGFMTSLESTSSGDGTVPINSAVLLPGVGLVVSAGHEDLPSHPAVLDQIIGMVLADNPLPPPPFAAQDMTVQSLPLAGPPFPSPTFGSDPVRDCRDGSCPC